MALCLAAAWAAVLATQAAAAWAKVPRLIFPVVGQVQYQDDFGDPRGQGTHEGNDLMAAWRSPAVAAEAGKVRIYTKSASAGCMLYLYGKSGTTYLYIHLNNDLGPDNDNEGGCKRGIAYAPGLEDGQSVRGGQLVGYVGDSGDANGIAYHLHFEVHPGDGEAVSPYRYLRRAEKLLFAAPEQEGARGTADAVTLTLAGTVVGYAEGAPGEEPPPAEPPPEGGSGGSGPGAGQGGGDGGDPAPAPPPPPPPARPLERAGGATGLLTVAVTSVRLSGGGSWRVVRRVVLAVPASAVLERASGKKVKWADLATGTRVSVTTAPVEISLETQRARPGVLQAARVLVRS